MWRARGGLSAKGKEGKQMHRTISSFINAVLFFLERIRLYLRANVPKNQRFSKYRGNSQKLNSAHILRLGRP